MTTRAQGASQKKEEHSAKDLDEHNLRQNPGVDYFSWLKKSYIMEQLQMQDPVLHALRQKILNNSLDKKAAFVLENGLLYYKNRDGKKRLAIPGSCTKYILNEFHDNRGHRPTKHLQANFSEQFWWSSLSSDCEVYYKSCLYCMKHRDNPKEKPGFLSPDVAKRTLANIACDFVGTLPKSKHGNQHICVIVD